MIMLSATLVGPGLRSVGTTSVSIRKLNRDVKDLITQGLLIMDSVKRVRWNIENLDVESILRVEEACPNFGNNTFISDKNLRSSINDIEKEFDYLKAYLQDSDLEGIRQHIDYIMDGTENIDIAVTVVEKNDWIVRMFALVLNVLVFFMIFAACTSLSGRCHYLPALKWMSECFILPLFVILIVISWFVTSILAFASVSNADFCVGNSQQSGPAGIILDIFEERGIGTTNDDIIYTAFSYYQSGCATEDPIKDLYKYEDGIQSGIGSANDFLTQTDEIGIDEINAKCGADVRPIIEGIGLIKDNLGILLSALRSMFELASCMNMSPKYRQAFEGTACTDSSESLTLMFKIMFGINVVGMMMIMLRSAVYPYKEVYGSSTLEDEEDEWEEYQAYLQYMSSFINIWGGSAADEDAVASKTGTASTESIVDSRPNTPGSFLNDEETPLSPQTPALGDSLRRAQMDEIYEDEEKMPLSPESQFSSGSINKTHDQPRMYTPQTKKHTDGGWEETGFIEVGCVVGRAEDVESSSPRRRRQQHRGVEMNFSSPVEKYRHSSSSLLHTSANNTEPSIGDDDECKPLSPQTPSINASARKSSRRFNFLTPELPETPLMTSPNNGQHEGVNYFSDIISPLRRGNQGEGGSVKRE